MGKIRKALVAAAAAAVSALGAALTAGHVGKGELMVVLGAAVAAGLAVWGVSNKAA